MPPIPANIFKCTICAKAYKYKHSLIRHQNICNSISGPPVYSCTTCKQTFNRPGDLNRHVKNVHKKIKNYLCVFCEKQFCTKGSLDRHILSHIGEKHFWCNICDCELSRKEALHIHHKTHKKPKPYKKFRCDTCSKSFDYNHSLIKHLQTHNPLRPRPYSCTICEIDFTTFTNLKQHTRVVHQKIKKYSCVFCEKQFGTVGCLNTHIINHIGEQPYFCDICDKEFSRRHVLRNHKKLHTKHNLFKCTKCSKAYITLEGLQVHRLNHEPKSFQCVICLKLFTSNKNLELHILMHVKEKPYFCSECDEEFKKKFTLNLHLRGGQCGKTKAISYKSFSSRAGSAPAETTYTEKTDGENGEDVMGEGLEQENENHVDVRIPNVCLPGDEESGTLPLNTAPEAVLVANSVRENTKRPEVKVCEVCGEHFSGKKVDKNYSMHIITSKHYLRKF